MIDKVPDHAQVVIIGGGIIGCSVAYHLTRLGCRDVVLLERKQLTSGTTSGMYGHTLGGAVGLGYVQHSDTIDQDFIESSSFEIEIAGQKFSADASLSAMYDPKGEKIKC